MRTHIHNLNRLLVTLLVGAASLLNGLNIAALLSIGAVVLWLWMPELDRAEARLVIRLARGGGKG